MPKKSKTPSVRIAVIGGSGIYEIDGMKVVEKFYPKTPFGYPSDPIVIGKYQGIKCAFLPRHGKGHRFLPSEIPQRANFFALKMLKVEFVIALSACGSLQEKLAPRDFVLPDQILDRTKGRPSTFFGGGIVAHIAFSDPFSHTLRIALAKSIGALNIPLHTTGTYVCMEGPAFSTQAESFFHRQNKADIIGMTAIPEAKLAREAEMAYALVAMVTDYDCWKEDEHVSVDLVIGNLMANAENAKKVVANVLPRLVNETNDCADALKGAIFTQPAAMKKSTVKKLGPLIRKYISL